MKTYFTLLIVLLFGLISVSKAQNVSFTADVTSGCAPLTVHFTNTSSFGANAVYQWHFGDSQNYSGQNAIYTFVNTNNQNVSLDAYDINNGSYLGNFSMQISVTGASQSFYMSTGSQICPGEMIYFSTNDQVSWVRFYFGDGDSSTWNWAPHVYQNPGVYNVMLVENTSCGIDTIVQTVTVSDTAVYNIQINMYGGNYFCPDEIVMFSNQNPAVSFLWDFGDSTYSSSSHPEHQYPNLGNYRVVLHATNMCGNMNSDTAWVYIMDNMNVWGNSNVSPNDVCPGQSVSYNSWSAGQQFWTFGDGTTSSEFNPNHAYADTGTYQISLILTNACGDSDTMYNSVHVGFHPTNPPSANIDFMNFNSWENGQPVDTLVFCPNTTVEFRNSTWSNSNSTTFFWNFGDGSTSTETNPTHTYVLPGIHTVMLIARDQCGAADTAYKWIVVNPSLMPQTQFQTIPESICPDESVYFIDNGYYYHNDHYSYSIWYGDGTSLLNFSENTDTLLNVLASHVYSTSGNYNYILTATNACGNSDSLTGTVVVYSNNNPNPLFYVDNSTSNNGLGNMPNWEAPSGIQDHQFYIPVHFPQWVPGMSDNYLIAFWYGHADLNNLGDPDGIMSVQGQITVHAYVPLLSDSVTILGVWFCGGQPSDSDPDAFGYLGVFPLVANGVTNVPEPGIVLSGWDGTCDSTQMQNENAACPGNNVHFSAIGGVAYEWHFGDGMTSTDPYANHAYSQTGLYDAFCIITNGCGVMNTLHTQVTVGDYILPQSSFFVDYGGNSCVHTPLHFWRNNNNNNQDPANFSYLWDFGDGSTSTEIYPVHEYSTGGQFIVTLTVSNGCGSSTSIQHVSISEPGITAVVSNGCYNANNGFIELNVTYGWNLTYLWSTGATTSDLNNLSPGLYNVTITEGNGCATYKEYQIEQVAPVQITPDINNISCNGLTDGSIYLTMSGGDAPYTYYWSTNEYTSGITGLIAGSYDVTVVDANGCSENHSGITVLEPAQLDVSLSGVNLTCYQGQNGSVNSNASGGTVPYSYQWSNGASTQNISSVAAGTYFLTVTDSQGCTLNNSVSLSEPSQIIISLDGLVHPACLASDGSISISVSGGIAGYTYLWSDAGAQTTQDAVGLGAGVYIVSVQDANNCLVNMFYALDNNNAPTVSLVITDALCNNGNNGKVNANVSGGIPGYSYLWSTGIILDSIVGLTAGTYTLTVTDNATCIATAIATVSQPDALVIDFTVQNVLCNGGSTGSISSVVNGGSPAYVYAWSNSTSGTDINSLIAGSYTLTITDSHNCILSNTISVNQPAALSASLNILTNVLCHGDHQGSADVSVSGGIPPYSYNWFDLSAGSSVSGLSGGVVGVTVTDANGCFSTQSGTILEPDALSTVITVQNVSCNGYLDGTASVAVTGGVATYTYIWSNLDNSDLIVYLPGNTYYVTVTDANGCEIIDTAVVYEPGQIYIDISGYNVTCNGLDNGVASVMATGGTGTFDYTWSNGGAAPNIFSLAPDIYTVTVTDDNNCTIEDAITITEPPALLVSSVITDASTSTSADGAIDLTVSGGTLPYDFNWSNSAHSEDISNLTTGNYWYVVSDANGCHVADTILVDFTNNISAVTRDIIKIFPNPTTGIVSVTHSGNVKIEVFNLIGNKVLEFENSNGMTSFDLSPFADGSYFIRMTKDDRSEIRKIILRK